MSSDHGKQTRRRFLATSAALGVATSLAGCSEGPTGQSFNDDSDASDESNTESNTETPSEDDSRFSYGSTREFTLEEGDGEDPRYNDLAKPVRFEASAGDEVTITQTSDAFDTYLVLEGPNGSVVAEDDDDGSGLNSRISTTLTESGEYVIWAGSFSGEETGPFTLSLEQGRDSGSNLGDADEITFGETLNFTLQVGDGQDPEYSDLAKPVRFEASAGDEVTITQTSDVFDTFLVLEGPSGSVVAENDDGAGIGLNSRISTTLTESGEYIIWAGSLSGEETGPFTLSLEQGLDSGTNSADVNTDEILFGETLNLTLQVGDGEDPRYNDLAKPVRFEASAGDEVTITQTSDAFDTYLVLEGPNGSVVAEDDDDGSGLNSRIRTTLTEGGEYVIWAGSFSGDETGPFTLSLEQGR